MSCSKEQAVTYLINKGLVKSENLELSDPVPSLRLSKTIDRLTQSAKTEYKVDMGDLFAVEFRNITVGDYAILGQKSIVTKTRLRPNEEAFEAIDRSQAMAVTQQEKELDEMRQKKLHDARFEYEKIQEEGNFVLTEDGEILVPSYLPKINITC